MEIFRTQFLIYPLRATYPAHRTLHHPNNIWRIRIMPIIMKYYRLLVTRTPLHSTFLHCILLSKTVNMCSCLTDKSQLVLY